LNRLLVYSLKGCDKCEYLLSKLDFLSIPYQKYVCEDESEICDNLEEFTNCFTYPILKVFNTNKTHLYLAVKGVKETNKTMRLSHFDVLEWHHSLDSVIDRIQVLLINK